MPGPMPGLNLLGLLAGMLAALLDQWKIDLAAPTGWNLNLAIEDPIEGLSWAISAIDAV